jgi:polyhydroxyalkanoate synthesis regulator phasin
MRTLYQVKFYGFTSEDARGFCRELARVLNTSEEQAWSYLMDAPLVIKGGLNKQEAQRLNDALVSIQALCLVEPMNGAMEEEEEPEPSKPRPVLVEPALDFAKRDQRSFKLWSAVLVGAVTALVVFGAIAYLGSYRSLSRVERPADERPPEVTAQKPVPEPGPETQETREQLTERIEALNQRFNDLRDQIKLLNDEINATAGAMGTDPVEMREKQRRLQAQRTVLVKIESELRSLRRQLAEMERE